MTKIFFSWSKGRSKSFGEFFSVWLPRVMQAVQPFISSDMEKGIFWASKIVSELQGCAYGIVIVTAENMSEPWLNFETGAMIGQLNKSVAPIAVGVRKGAIANPIGILNATDTDRNDIFKLVESVNAKLDEPLSSVALQASFDSAWPSLNEKINALALQSFDETPSKSFTIESKLVEISEVLQAQSRGLSQIMVTLDNIDSFVETPLDEAPHLADDKPDRSFDEMLQSFATEIEKKAFADGYNSDQE